MTGGRGGSRDGFVLVLVVLVVLAVSGLGTIGLKLALAESRLGTAVRLRVGSDLLAEGALAMAMATPLARETPGPMDSAGSVGGPLDTGSGWTSGASGSSVEWLTDEIALVRAWGRASGARTERRIGTLVWALDGSRQPDFGGPGIGVDGSVQAPEGFSPAVDSCGLVPGPTPLGPLPPRWTAPLDLELGWRGRRPPSGSELSALGALSVVGSLVLIDEAERSVADSLGPALIVASGSVILEPGAHVTGLLIVPGTLTVRTGARLAGVLRILGDLTVEPGAEVRISPCLAGTALDSTGWASGLRPLHGFVGRIAV